MLRLRWCSFAISVYVFFQKLVELIQNHNMQVNIFILFICILLIQLFDTKIIISLVVVIYIFINYDTIKVLGNTDKQIKEDVKKGDISDDLYYNTILHDLLIQLKKYKKYNKVSYKDGVKYMRKFFKTIKILEKDTINKELIINKYESKVK